MEKEQCDNILKKVLERPGKYSRKIRLIIKELKMGESCYPQIQCGCIKAIGGFKHSDKNITLNPKRLDNAQSLLATLLHELIHAWQHCNIPRVNSCEGAICRELAANRESGCCMNRALWPSINHYKNVRDCVVRKASASAKKHCKDLVYPKEVINKVESMYKTCSDKYYIKF